MTGSIAAVNPSGKGACVGMPFLKSSIAQWTMAMHFDLPKQIRLCRADEFFALAFNRGIAIAANQHDGHGGVFFH